jgi:transposase
LAMNRYTSSKHNALGSIPVNKKYHVQLSGDQRQQLERLIGTGAAPARTQTHARILLKADAATVGGAWPDERIAEACDVSIPTIERVRRAFVTEGLDLALYRRRPQGPSRRRKLDGRQQAHLIAVTCGPPPEGQGRWTLALLADKLVELHIVNAIARETVRQTLQHNELKPWLKREWKIPPKANAGFVAQMEDVLSVYTRPLDPKHPLICFDESNKEQHIEVETALPMQVGQPLRYESTFERNGVSNLFMFFAPLHNWRHVKVTDRRTNADWAQCMKDLVDVHFPDAERIVLVQDNLSTHTPAALYSAFAPEEAKRIWDRLEFHYTPKYGSWLNMAEIELSVLARQCLKRRIPDQPSLRREVAAWERDRNRKQATVQWRFTTVDARIKLAKLYPTIEPIK